MADETKNEETKAVVGLYGLAVMGQNLALNIASKGFPIAVCNRSPEKIDVTVQRAKDEGNLPLVGYKNLADFVEALETPRKVIILVKAGKPVDAVIEQLSALMEPGDLIVDGGNEWFPNTLRRGEELEAKGLRFMGMGVSGGEEGARNGPSLMPGSTREAYDMMEPILKKIAAQVNDEPCVCYVGELGAGNYVKMVHNGIEYGDMQLIAEAYDILKTVGAMSNEALAKVFDEWNSTELDSFLIEITAKIFAKKDDEGEYVLDTILDKTGMKGTGKWTIQEAAEKHTAAPTISGALDARFLSGIKEERVKASKILKGPTDVPVIADKARVVEDVRKALYLAKIVSYAQGFNIIREAGKEYGWELNMGEIGRIWKGGCIIRAAFLDRIREAYERNPALESLLLDPKFAEEVNERAPALRRIVSLAAASGIPVPSFGGSLSYLDAYRRERLPANLTQAQRDFFGAHTYERVDKEGSFHFEWSK